MMISEDLRVGISQALEQRSGSLDVSEEKGERLRGQQASGFHLRLTLSVSNARSPAS